MAFSPPEYCRLFAQRKAYQGGSQAPQDPPSYAPGWEYKVLQKLYYYAKFQLKRLKISLKEITS